MTDPLALPFDIYQRYRLVADLLERARRAVGAKRLQVLDVGGRTGILRAFDREDQVLLVDLVSEQGVGGVVLGDGCRLPFADGSFDAVCAFDTLEHVAPERRDDFVDECARVARRWVVLAGPYASPDVERAEELLRRFLRDKLRTSHRYLEEHHGHGLPDRGRVEERLRAREGEVLSIGHASIDRWLPLMSLSMLLDDDPALRALAKDVYRFYNERLYASDHAAPVYRHAVVAAFAGAPLPDLEGLLESPGSPRGALEPFAELAGAFAEFDREREAWREERESFHGAVRDLEIDLAGHRESLEEARREIESRDRRVRELGQAVDGALAELESLAHRAEARRAEAEDLLRRFEAEREQVAVRDAELARLGAALEEARAEVESLRHEAAAARAERDALGHRAAAAEARERDWLERFEREHAEVGTRDAELGRLAAESERLRHAEVAARAEAEALGHRAAAAADLEEDWRERFEQEREQVGIRDAEIERLATELAAARSVAEERDELERAARALREEVQEHAARLAASEGDRAAAERRARELEEALSAGRGGISERDARIAELQQRVAHLDAHLRAREEELARLPLAAVRRVLWLVYGRPPG